MKRLISVISLFLLLTANISAVNLSKTNIGIAALFATGSSLIFCTESLTDCINEYDVTKRYKCADNNWAILKIKLVGFGLITIGCTVLAAKFAYKVINKCVTKCAKN